MSKYALRVKNVHKSFRLPTEQANGIKQAFVNWTKGVKGYQERKILKGVSFTVEKGDFFGIVGRNGSGKSTLLKIIADIYMPDSGSVTTEGKLVPFIELGVGFNPELTGRENVYLNGALLGFSKSEIDAIYDDIVNFAELHDFMEEKLKNYSSGMQVRLAFSVAIQAKGDILILDEVLAVGDAAFQQKCFDYFESVKRSEQTVIFVTHDMNAVRRFCSRAIYIEDGHIKMAGSPSEIADTYTEVNIESATNVAEEDHDNPVTVKLVLPEKKSFTSDEMLVFEVVVDGLDEEVFINSSLVSGGFVFADRNSRDMSKKFITNNTPIQFRQPLDQLNPGKYDIHLSIHRKKDDGMIKHLPRAYSFIVKGHDILRDGPMKSAGSWHTKERMKHEK